MQTRNAVVLVGLAVLVLFLGARHVLAQDVDPEAPQAALGTAFTYQG
jgi:predicted RNA methylase